MSLLNPVTDHNLDEETLLARYFPVDEQVPKQTVSETTGDEMAGRLRDIQTQAASFIDSDAHDRHGKESLRISRYHSYKSEEDLPPIGKDFFHLAARLAGLSVPMLVRAVNMLEGHIVTWQKEQRRAASERRERSRSFVPMESDTEQPTYTE